MARSKKPSTDVHLELLVKISDHIEKTSSSIASLDKKLDLHIQKTELELKRIHEQDTVQNRLLDEHIAGVNTLRAMYEAHEKKDLEMFEQLQAPRKWMQGTVKLVAIVGAIAGGLAGIVKLLIAYYGR